MKIHYISSYVDSHLLGDYRTTPSCIAKINYVKDAIKRSGYSLSLFSPVTINSKNFKIARIRYFTIDNNETHFYPLSFGGNSRIIRVVSYLVIYIQLFFYLLCCVKRNESVLLYHALPDTKVVQLIRKILHFKLYIELEELYSAVFSRHDEIEKEKILVKQGVKGYISVNRVIGDRCRLIRKQAICEGQYKLLVTEPKLIINNDGRIHILYAGVFEKNADVFVAIEMSKYLGEQYVLHIAGYGQDDVVSLVEQTIKKMPLSKSNCSVIYQGCLHGKEYEDLLSICGIGLCTRVLANNLSDYTFPSKVFAYLARNLKVVCTPISCVLISPLADTIQFSKTTNPADIANAVKSIDTSSLIDNYSLLKTEDDRFCNSLKDLFSE